MELPHLPHHAPTYSRYRSGQHSHRQAKVSDCDFFSAWQLIPLASSEIAPHAAAKLVELIPEYLDNDCVKVVTGDKDVVTALLTHPFGHIIYTGNNVIAKIIMTAAAKHLTPITLELGGKSPVIVSDKANIKLAAKRITWGKFFNAGQTCMCTDYALVHEGVLDEFLEAMKKVRLQAPLVHENVM